VYVNKFQPYILYFCFEYVTELSLMCRFCAHYIFGYESKGSLCHHFCFCEFANNKLYIICSQAYYPLVPRLFVSYYVLNPTCAVASVHSLLHAESHLSCSISSFVITYRIPRVLFRPFFRYYMLIPTCLAPFLHLLLRTKSHVSCSVCSFVITYQIPRVWLQFVTYSIKPKG